MTQHVLDEAGVRRGPAVRDYMDRLPAREVARLRAMLDLGLENVDVAREMGLNRSAVMHHRRAYDAELAALDRAPTEPVREGRIAGRALPAGLASRLRALLLRGVPASAAAIALEVSRPCATRHRAALVADLAALGRTIPGCDATGAVIGRRSGNAISDAVVDDVRRRLLVPERIPAIAAATGVSAPTVRRIWRGLKPTLETAPLCPCGREAHHAQRCRPTASIDPRLDGAALRALAEAAVPRHHDPALRADILQDVTATILALPKAPSDLAQAVRQAASANYRRFANRWGDLSLDAPIGHDGTRTLLDVLAEKADPREA